MTCIFLNYLILTVLLIIFISKNQTSFFELAIVLICSFQLSKIDRFGNKFTDILRAICSL